MKKIRKSLRIKFLLSLIKLYYFKGGQTLSLFKFLDSNFLSHPNHPSCVAGFDTYNGYQFKVVSNTATVIATDTEAKTANINVMMNIIDKPEIWNTDEYKVTSGQYIRAFKLKDYAGLKISMSQDLVYFRDIGTKQVETATVVGTIGAAGQGNSTIIVTASGMTGSPKTVSVAVANNDSATSVAGKIATALIADANIGNVTTGYFTVTTTGATVILTANIAKVNDTTMNISIDNGTCSGLTAAPTSANTTAGKIPITTNALMWADLTAGDYLVPRVTDDTDYTAKWKKVSSVSGYGLYLEVVKKTALGTFTADSTGGTVLGGLVCRIVTV